MSGSETDDNITPYEEAADRFIGERSDGGAVLWYGVASLAISFGSAFSYKYSRDNQYVALAETWF